MKVVIELSGNESAKELLATSDYLRAMAAEGDFKAKATEPKTDLDKLADRVAEATQVKEEAPKTRTRRTAKTAPAPAEEPAPTPEPEPEPEPAPAPAPEPAPAPAPAAAPQEDPKEDETTITIDECKSWAMKALNAKKRHVVQEAFESVGASSFPTLKEPMFKDFVNYISSRL